MARRRWFGRAGDGGERPSPSSSPAAPGSSQPQEPHSHEQGVFRSTKVLVITAVVVVIAGVGAFFLLNSSNSCDSGNSNSGTTAHCANSGPTGSGNSLRAPAPWPTPSAAGTAT